MCIREPPNPNERRRQVKLVRDDGFRHLVDSCLMEAPGDRPNMEEIITKHLNETFPSKTAYLYSKTLPTDESLPVVSI